MKPTFQLPKVGEPVSLKDKAYNAIKSAILSLKFKPGDLHPLSVLGGRRDTPVVV